MKKLGIIGLGHMGMALAKGAVRSLGSDAVAAFDPSCEKCDAASAMAVTICRDIQEVCRTAHIVVIAVRPQDISPVLEELKQTPPQCLLTIAAGIPISRFTAALGELPVIRVMPNTPLQLFEGAAALCKNDACPEEDFQTAMDLFSSLGTACRIEESHMCDIIAVNGSTPAYFYYLIECLMEDAVSRGIDPSVARDLLVQTMIGSGKLLQADRDKPIHQFVDEVCSKGGTTIEAINVMKDGNLKDLIVKADTACIRRAEELGNE